MRNRRFVLLAALLTALNLSLWVVPQGLALQRVLVSTLFGKNLVRADVTENSGCPSACVEWRIARGIVVSNSLGVLTVQEADTKVETITTSSSTKVTGIGKISKIRPGWRILATWPAPSGTADSVVVERK